MKFSLLPKEIKFFDLFDEQAKILVTASACFLDLVNGAGFDDAGIQKMRDIEHTCDNVTHDIIEKLNRTFITPFDREDIHALAHEVDNVVDMLFTISKRIWLYKLNSVDRDLIQFAQLINQSVNSLAKALNGLRDQKNTKPIKEHCIEINRLENLGDQLRDAVIGRLFDNSGDPISIFKWKEIFEGAETVLDICEDVANVIESIMVKQA